MEYKKKKKRRKFGYRVFDVVVIINNSLHHGRPGLLVVQIVQLASQIYYQRLIYPLDHPIGLGAVRWGVRTN